MSHDSATLTWEVPTIDGGAPVNNYIVEKREATMRAFKTITTKCSKTFYRVTNLIEGTFYYFRVIAENMYGIGESCETADAMLISEVPSVPQMLQVDDITKSSITLSWEKPLHDGGSRLTSYIIEACRAGTDRWMRCTSVKPQVTKHTITSLNENEEYLFRIRAQNDKGISDPRELITSVTIREFKGTVFVCIIAVSPHIWIAVQ